LIRLELKQLRGYLPVRLCNVKDTCPNRDLKRGRRPRFTRKTLRITSNPTLPKGCVIEERPEALGLVEPS
jgi:hypothetical protein